MSRFPKDHLCPKIIYFLNINPVNGSKFPWFSLWEVKSNRERLFFFSSYFLSFRRKFFVQNNCTKLNESYTAKRVGLKPGKNTILKKKMTKKSFLLNNKTWNKISTFIKKSSTQVLKRETNKLKKAVRITFKLNVLQSNNA